MCVRMTVHNCRTQHNIGPITVLIIFPRMFQTILAQMTTTDGRGGGSHELKIKKIEHLIAGVHVDPLNEGSFLHRLLLRLTRIAA